MYWRPVLIAQERQPCPLLLGMALLRGMRLVVNSSTSCGARHVNQLARSGLRMHTLPSASRWCRSRWHRSSQSDARIKGAVARARSFSWRTAS